jgi:antitoxin component of RelBE/YafQ-DinJ toxin-antitoxin module
MTCAINSFLRAVIRERRIPFQLRTKKAFVDDMYQEYIYAELQKSKALLDDPNVKLTDADEVSALLDKKRKERGL